MPTTRRRELNEFETFLKRKGLHLTQPRLKIAEAVFHRKGHFTAEDLANELIHGGQGIGRGTVYRTLTLLRQAGLAKERSFSPRIRHFEAHTGVCEHEHMICTECGRIVEFKDEHLSDLAAKLSKRQAFSLAYYDFKIYGRCSNCR